MTHRARYRNIGQPLRLQSLFLLKRHDAYGSKRIDRALFGLRCCDRDGIQRLNRAAADLRPRTQYRRGSGLHILRLCRLALGLLLFLPLCGTTDSFRVGCLCIAEIGKN